MTSRSRPTAPKPTTPWRRGPMCPTKRAQASFARYCKKQKEPKA